MKIIFIFSSVFVAFSADASPCVDCPAQVIEIAGWQSHSQDQLQCIRESTDFKDGIEYLCAANLKSLSVQYAKYRSYEVPYNDEMNKVLHATDPVEKSDHIQKAMRIERDWNLFGFRGEVSGALNSIDSAEYNCSPRSL
jgi:hypothetical protein